MEKSETRKASEIPDEFPLFKLHLSFIEHAWSDPQHEISKIESYKSENGCYFSCIYQHDAENKIGNLGVFIDPNASLLEVNQFSDKILRKEIMENISPSMFSLNLQSSYLEEFCGILTSRLNGSHCEIKEVFDHYMVIAPPTIERSYDLPPGYKFGQLDESHLSWMVEYWKRDISAGGAHGTMTAIKAISFAEGDRFSEMMQRNITTRPSASIFYNDEPQPAAWVQTYNDGAAGTLHVVDAHRRKGLARVLLRRIANEIVDVHSASPHGCIKLDNVGSKKLCLSEGWILQPVNYKKLFFNAALANL